MDFSLQYLSFFVIQPDGDDPSGKAYKHFKTMDSEAYAGSELNRFLDGEFARICKRKVEKNPISDQAPTKIGHFIVEPGCELESNPNYNMLQRIREAGTAEAYHNACDDLVRAYLAASAVRGGALIVARAGLPRVFDAPLLFVMKCDFENKIVRITDEASLVGQVDMAISAKTMKSILYPHMPEEGMLNDWEVKIHQSSHSRYFEDFLKYVTYEQALPEWTSTQVMNMVQEYMDHKYDPAGESAAAMDPEVRERETMEMEIWSASKERDLQEKWDHDTVVEASQRMLEMMPELDLKFKLDEISVKGKLSDYGNRIHFARLGDRYVVLLEGDSFQFDKGCSPVELLAPEELDQVVEKLKNR